jgi:hypothetical protein
MGAMTENTPEIIPENISQGKLDSTPLLQQRCRNWRAGFRKPRTMANGEKRQIKVVLIVVAGLTVA